MIISHSISLWLQQYVFVVKHLSGTCLQTYQKVIPLQQNRHWPQKCVFSSRYFWFFFPNFGSTNVCALTPLIFFYYLRKFCISNRISKIPNGTQYIYIYFLSWHLTLIWLVTYWWCWSWTVKAGISNENTPCVHKYVYIYMSIFRKFRSAFFLWASCKYSR